MAGRLLIKNGVLAAAPAPKLADVLCEGPRIVAIGRNIRADGAQVLDAAGLTIGPGFIDVHVHGGGGSSFFTRDPQRVRDYGRWAPRNGVTSFLISTVGRDDADTLETLWGLAPTVGQNSGAEPLGFHLEGPFINPVRKGAFPPDFLRAPARDEFARYQDAAGGMIRQVTMAPELPLALELATAIAVSGAIPSMGHTDATSIQALVGFEAGIRHVTHLYNAMRPIHQREGGPVVAALLQNNVTCELICDGAHVAPELLRLAYNALGPARTVVVTDNLHIAGTELESGEFGGENIVVSGSKAVRTDGTIVGSVSTMDQHFRNTVAFLGIDLSTAFRLCAANPARVAQAQERKGVIERGMDADIVLLDPEMQVAATICRGEIAYRRPAP
jgi:N-acetylglucosamine-6-phosphate deacetylase